VLKLLMAPLRLRANTRGDGVYEGWGRASTRSRRPRVYSAARWPSSKQGKMKPGGAVAPGGERRGGDVSMCSLRACRVIKGGRGFPARV
jgi:hypothetical protein